MGCTSSQSSSSKYADIVVWNRGSNQQEVEQVADGGVLHWLYDTKIGKFVEKEVTDTEAFSEAVGEFVRSELSHHKIKSFVEEFHIDMAPFRDATDTLFKEYKSFNDWFIRQFKNPSVSRPIAAQTDIMPAFADARYYAYNNIQRDHRMPIKGKRLGVTQFLRDADAAAPFIGGPMVIARLAPVDYHRFHFPDSGVVIEHYKIDGKLHSVSAIAIGEDPDILIENERQVTIMATENFGMIAYIEIGATTVGTIIQEHDMSQPFQRGACKGWLRGHLISFLVDPWSSLLTKRPVIMAICLSP